MGISDNPYRFLESLTYSLQAATAFDIFISREKNDSPELFQTSV